MQSARRKCRVQSGECMPGQAARCAGHATASWQLAQGMPVQASVGAWPVVWLWLAASELQDLLANPSGAGQELGLELWQQAWSAPLLHPLLLLLVPCSHVQGLVKQTSAGCGQLRPPGRRAGVSAARAARWPGCCAKSMQAGIRLHGSGAALWAWSRHANLPEAPRRARTQDCWHWHWQWLRWQRGGRRLHCCRHCISSSPQTCSIAGVHRR